MGPARELFGVGERNAVFLRADGDGLLPVGLDPLVGLTLDAHDGFERLGMLFGELLRGGHDEVDVDEALGGGHNAAARLLGLDDAARGKKPATFLPLRSFTERLAPGLPTMAKVSVGCETPEAT